MKFIVSVDMNWGIGKDNDLLMRIPDDMKQFREKTTGNVIVMGRKTLESFPNSKPLPNRLNLVITSNKDYYADGVVICHSIDEALEKIKELNKDVYIDEKIRLQGIMDCFFEEEDGIVLLDYKTDYVEEGKVDEIIERYRAQLKYYKDALEKITEKRVKESYLYLFAIDREILVEI